MCALPDQPARSELPNRRLSGLVRDVLAAVLLDLDRGRELLGVALGLEAALLGLLVLGRAVANLIPLKNRGNVEGERSG